MTLLLKVKFYEWLISFFLARIQECKGIIAAYLYHLRQKIWGDMTIYTWKWDLYPFHGVNIDTDVRSEQDLNPLIVFFLFCIRLVELVELGEFN